MQSKYNQPLQYSKILHWYDVITCIYVSGLVAILNYTNLFLKIGYYDNIFIIIALVATEVLKYTIYITVNKNSPRKNIIKDLFKTLLTLSTVFTVFYVVSVLFGAPVFSNFEQTVMFALLMTTLTAVPVCLYLGHDNTINMFLSLTSYEGNEINRLFMTKIRLTLFGAWLGAFVIPLDWKRAWQDWPIPCCIGGLLGYIVANFVTSVLQLRQQGRVSRKTGKYTL